MIIQNALKITEKGKVTYIRSSHRHDFVSYRFKDGSTIFTDGGNSYTRRGGIGIKPKNKDTEVEDFSLTSESFIDEIRAKLLWATNGPKGDKPTKVLPIKDLALDHLQAILHNMLNINPIHQSVVKYWILEKQKK